MSTPAERWARYGTQFKTFLFRRRHSLGVYVVAGLIGVFVTILTVFAWAFVKAWRY